MFAGDLPAAEEMLPGGYSPVARAGVLSLSGREAPDLLNRLSTNSLSALPERTPRRSVLTNEKGRIVDLIDVIRSGDETYVLASDPAAVAAWLRRYIIMEEIEVREISHLLETTLLMGAEIIDQAPLTNLGGGGEGMTIVFEDDLWPFPLLKCVTPAGFFASGHFPLIPPESMEALRIACGVPAYGSELTGQVNPLEAGLHRYVSFSKGCYIGQEVIARIDTYDKLQRSLVGCSADAEITAGMTFYSAGVASGEVTSAARSPRTGVYHALGYVRQGRDLSVGPARIPVAGRVQGRGRE